MTDTERFQKNCSLVGYVYQKEFAMYESYAADLIQEGNLALWKACKTYDESRGTTFSTFAYAVIRNAMRVYKTRVIEKHSGILSLDSPAGSENSEVTLKDILYAAEDNSAKYLIEVCLAKTPAKDQLILKRLMQGYTQEEIAHTYHMAQSTVSKCLNRFKKLLLEEQE